MLVLSKSKAVAVARYKVVLVLGWVLKKLTETEEVKMACILS